MELEDALSGETAPPMANGELLFEAPWEARAFGMARALCEAGCYSWDEFRDSLIAEISAWDRTHAVDDPYHYYELFFAALEKLLAAKDICIESDLAARTEAFQNRPHGHDHSH